MFSKRKITISFDVSDPDEKAAYEFYNRMGRKKSRCLTHIANLVEAAFGPVLPNTMEGQLMVMTTQWGMSGIRTPAAPAQIPAPVRAPGEKQTKKTEKTEARTKKQAKNSSLAPRPKEVPEPVAEAQEASDRSTWNDELGMDDPTGLLDKLDASNVWKLKEQQAGMTTADLFK